ncbi:MAG: hypothetical protein UU12_C0002G0008 [Candidatus Woesebacteria bacterium GW2011_GWA2_40_7b]|uniref:Uncharacterized protein n=1 Tax=Candidatus Woesebacteria bacterium GW2011_GWA2_40_7b TaxID=1618563 RepID=A0A0G0VH30_9BACT|nr:MAG: hypothetical protein UU12_C0002G0008 [Candidatus Woesebacteria bacterium GW2011_GWA2_40_7b]
MCSRGLRKGAKRQKTNQETREGAVHVNNGGRGNGA